MKSIITYLIAFSMTLTRLQAQTITSLTNNRWGAGVFAGLSSSYPRIITQFPDHFAPRTNLLAGIDLHYTLTNRASLHIQPLWTQIKSAKQDRFYSLNPIFSFTTVKIPVLYRYYVLPTRKFLFVEAGVSYNQIAKSSYKEEIAYNCIVGPCPSLYTPNLPAIAKSAISGLAGVGVNIELHKISIPITIRYERYLSGYTFPRYFNDQTTAIKFENFGLMTGINF